MLSGGGDQRHASNFWYLTFTFLSRPGQDTSAAGGGPGNGGCLLLLRNRQSITLVLVSPPHSESYNCIKRNVQCT